MPGKRSKVGGLEALGVAEHAAQHAGPGILDDQVAAAFLNGMALGADDGRVHAGQGLGGRARLERGGVGHGRDEDAAGLGLPPGVHDGQFIVADVLVVPHPGLGVDGLAHGAQDAQAGGVVLGGPVHALAHERADDRGRGVEGVHLELLHDLPEARRIGIRGHGLEHHGRGAHAQGPVDDVAVARDPADVRRAPEHVVVLDVEDVFHGARPCRSGSRPWCAPRPWACPWSQRCRGCTGCPRRPCARARPVRTRHRPPFPRATRSRGRRSCPRRCPRGGPRCNCPRWGCS